MKTRESEEMYLETILLLQNKNGSVRSIDIAAEMNYAKSSVSRGVNLLKGKGYITMDKNGTIRFTDSGLKKAQNIYDRHCALTNLLEMVGADKETAEDNACRIEHVITEKMYNIIKTYVEK